jgi:antitoxin component of MazEF toxin-antitoxin module
MAQEAEVKFGKKFVVHIPEALAERLDLREGGKLSLYIEGDKLVFEPLRRKSAVELAVKGKKFASLRFDEVEKISEDAQRNYENTP